MVWVIKITISFSFFPNSYDPHKHIPSCSIPVKSETTAMAREHLSASGWVGVCFVVLLLVTSNEYSMIGSRRGSGDLTFFSLVKEEVLWFNGSLYINLLCVWMVYTKSWAWWRKGKCGESNEKGTFLRYLGTVRKCFIGLESWLRG